VTAAARVAIAFMVLGTAPRAGTAASPSPSKSDREARRAFQSAEAHFRGGRFAEALAEYQAGYDKAPLPGFLINIAQCQRRLGDLHKARATYQKFVIVAPDSPHVPEVRGVIGELDRVIAELDEKTATDAARQEEVVEAVALAAGSEPRPRDPAAVAPTATVPAASPPVIAGTPVLITARAPAGEAHAPAARSRWWLWTAIGVAVAGGTATAFVLTRSPGTTTLHEGSLGTLRR
jgi:hypothetical protein